MSTKKDDLKPIVSGNRVIIPIHKKGNSITLSEHITARTGEWQRTNLDKEIIEDTQRIDEIPATASRAGFVRSVSYLWRSKVNLLNIGKRTSRYPDHRFCHIFCQYYDQIKYHQIQALREIVRQDFPDVQDKDLIFGQFIENGNCFFDFSFSLPSNAHIPESYTRLN